MMEKREFLQVYRDFMSVEGRRIDPKYMTRLKNDIRRFTTEHDVSLEALAKSMRTAMIAHREISLGHHSIEAILLYTLIYKTETPISYVEERYGETTAELVEGLTKVYDLYSRKVAVESENFRKLLISFARDVRVIMIMIVERLDTMRNLQYYSEPEQQEIAREVSYLYAPLAHRMGLYGIKTELEDLSLKFTSREIYKEIATKLNETKRSRDAYIKKFIEPVKARLEAEGLKFSIKGRTKSIHSIWNKIRKQQVPFEKVYDLFAIRIIIDCPVEREKSACWQAFSVVTDMYTANTKRLRDWISVPKSNGYESLHVTVMGPEGKWVEVQIRTERMDEVAEKGVAAHWKYKGGKSDSAQMDEWLKNLRDMLEQGGGESEDGAEVMNEFKMQLYDDDVFVFTPKGDLHQLHRGATVLDFAFGIHTKIGSQCMGAIVNGKHVSFKYELQNGDQVEVLTSPTQTPRADWLNWTKTSKARSRIKQALKEAEHREAENGRETLLRRLKNWKLEFDDSLIGRAYKKLGYKTLSDFYVAINQEKVNLLQLRDWMTEGFEAQEQTPTQPRTADGYEQETELQRITAKDDALVIDRNLKNVDYTLARCCNPIYGDEIFGFVSVSGGIKIHKKDCPNAPQLISRFGYRIVNARWAGGSTGGEYTTTIRIIGRDDIGIVTNITSVISKEQGINMRSISVDSNAGLFEGTITLVVRQASQLEALFKKLHTIKGVKQIFRV
ncbi:MAG: bifunctional (p)ppGpp synthetase/guanosine-3',5'-bis(diphosphate) 3'-pyrophosphohydrolase [Paludibacteraceae bacterium]|nr:bifunctional (p)ppGpp synthetase/guanosine-3',5'-bis(diphosphate) 3'-pyrophosphohydrolase [Paludibacteraceae bacterium]